MITRDVEITRVVRVTVDETKFTPEFLEEFARFITNYDTVDEHITYLAGLHAAGVIDESSFAEGYGKLEDFGVRFEIIADEDRILEEEKAA